MRFGLHLCYMLSRLPFLDTPSAFPPPSRHTPSLPFLSSNSPITFHYGSVGVDTLTARRARPSSKNSGKSVKGLASSTQTAGILPSEVGIAEGRWQGKPGDGWRLGSLRAGREGTPHFLVIVLREIPIEIMYVGLAATMWMIWLMSIR